MNTLRLILPDTDDTTQAKRVWEAACAAAGVDLQVLVASDAIARQLARELGLNTYPALLQANRIIAVGTPDAKTARDIVERLSGEPSA